jgi:hypothetical protein
MFQPRSFLISSQCFLDLVRSLIPCWAVTDLLTSPSQSFRLLVPNCEPATLRVAVSDTALCRPEPAPFPRGDCGCPLSQLDRSAPSTASQQSMLLQHHKLSTTLVNSLGPAVIHQPQVITLHSCFVLNMSSCDASRSCIDLRSTSPWRRSEMLPWSLVGLAKAR